MLQRPEDVPAASRERVGGERSTIARTAASGASCVGKRQAGSEKCARRGRPETRRRPARRPDRARARGSRVASEARARSGGDRPRSRRRRRRRSERKAARPFTNERPARPRAAAANERCAGERRSAPAGSSRPGREASRRDGATVARPRRRPARAPEGGSGRAAAGRCEPRALPAGNGQRHACARHVQRRRSRRGSPRRRLPVRDSASPSGTSSALPRALRRDRRRRVVDDEVRPLLGAVARHVARPEDAPCGGPARASRVSKRWCRRPGTSASATPSTETPDVSIVPASSALMSRRAAAPTGCPGAGQTGRRRRSDRAGACRSP